MSFVSRFNTIIEKRGASLTWKLSLHTTWFSTVVFLVCLWYLILVEQETLPVTVNKALADTAMVLIGLSFALSGLCYFWDVVDTKIVYRKYLGLFGFAFGLGHAVMSDIFYFVFKPHGYEHNPIFELTHQWDFHFFVISNLYAFAAAVVSLCIYALMAIISNQYAIHELGGVWWRRILRIGYLAYILSAFHFSLKNIPDWIELLEGGNFTLPPLNFILLLLVLFVVVLRLALWRSLAHQAKIVAASSIL